MNKIVILGILIIASILQTMGLWTGGELPWRSLISVQESTLYPIKPESIWINTGGKYTKAYRITNSQNEYDAISSQLQEAMLSYNNFEELGYSMGDWQDILTQKGIVYQYSVPVTIDEIVGKSMPLQYNYKIDSVLIKFDESSAWQTTIYLINELNEYYLEIVLHNRDYDFNKIYSMFEIDNDNDNVIQYQPSITDIKSQFIHGNVFLANTSEAIPLKYTPIIFKNDLIDTKNQMATLEGYVDQFFEKPIMKETKVLFGGTIEFTEPLKSIVRYNTSGVIQYINLVSGITTNPMTRIEGYDIAVDFIEETQSISPSIKENLYLSNIGIEQGAYVFEFDIMYEGHKVDIGASMKRKLDITSAITIKVKDYRVIEGKWITYNIYTDYVSGTRLIVEGYAPPIDRMYSNLRSLGVEQPVFDSVELIYVLESSNSVINLNWGVQYEGIWYVP
ncbi:MAG: hypothetical protein ATN35_03080 [Epulopiscium sp. Nele67-Bin004]|nr:MAG: hypothetical protein ATN35_03080 [Epulopiscium sp. Nele67-Bin004]